MQLACLHETPYFYSVDFACCAGTNMNFQLPLTFDPNGLDDDVDDPEMRPTVTPVVSSSDLAALGPVYDASCADEFLVPTASTSQTAADKEGFDFYQ